MKIGIFGGTFDPFTIAHLAIVEKVLEDKLVDKVIIVPSVVSWHREGKEPFLQIHEKIKIIHNMVFKSKFRDHIQTDFSELYIGDSIKENRRYLHTLVEATQKYGLVNEYYTIIGTDSLWNFNTWWNYDNILKMSKLIAVSGRDGIMLPNETYDAIIVDIDKKFRNISASKIRENFKSVDEYLASLNLS